MRYLEDFTPGEVIEIPGRTITEEEIVRFATEFDPQPFHIDKEAAESHMFGGLIASGWHTAAIMMRALVDGYISKAASLGSPGIDELRWVKPVRPGDTLKVKVYVDEVTPSKSKPHMGVLKSHTEVLNQHDEVVMTLKGMGMYKTRPKDET
jgi:acyl dehydratase